ncbi:MAG TPA: hypothetical protein VNF07_01235 [Acidimicrobiales bacterium]|nr:hypothetical protein [Acidimicrobiales bacterium]
MAPRRDFGATGIARQNAAVWITVGWWLTRLLLPTAVVCFAVSTAIGLHDHVVVTPSFWLHHLGAGGAAGSLRHLIVMLAITFVGMTLESLVLCRDAFARREPAAAIASVLATARRLLLGTPRAELRVVIPLAPQAASHLDRDPDSGILRQLRSALSIAPVGPPAGLALSSDPRGPFAPSGHQAEDCAAA